MLEEILTYSSPKKKQKITLIALEKYEPLGLRAPAILARLMPQISAASFVGMHQQQARFCDHVLIVEGKEIWVNKLFLSVVSGYFKMQFDDTWRKG